MKHILRMLESRKYFVCVGSREFTIQEHGMHDCVVVVPDDGVFELLVCTGDRFYVDHAYLYTFVNGQMDGERVCLNQIVGDKNYVVVRGREAVTFKWASLEERFTWHYTGDVNPRVFELLHSNPTEADIQREREDAAREKELRELREEVTHAKARVTYLEDIIRAAANDLRSTKGISKSPRFKDIRTFLESALPGARW